ncbi:MAG: methylmalonyl Co-A mutase-associated GTPase MeaB [Bacteroidota bacterium]|nr:methylmalonyl Co-A mutase-associated GTPase MeaB [Bacteroidota bacterium]
MPEKNPKSALNVMNGVNQPSQINEEALRKLKRPRQPEVAEFVAGIREGNRTLLSKAITLVESSLHIHQEKAQLIIEECLKSCVHKPGNQSIRIGITGVPGVGKSTFIESFGKYLTTSGHKIAVLAIDPSSSRSKGSILGDKTRMEELSIDPNAFIRPSPSAGTLGGVARKTRETILLCEAAGFDIILVETVGVGQSETEVHGMVDFFLLLMLAGAGDELQGIKRGIIEMADAILINKADGDNVKNACVARSEYANALHFFPPAPSGWNPVVATCSSRTGKGIPEIWKIISEYRELTFQNGYFNQRRLEQSRKVFFDSIEDALKSHFFSNKEIHNQLHSFEKEILEDKINPYKAAQMLLAKYFTLSPSSGK